MRCSFSSCLRTFHGRFRLFWHSDSGLISGQFRSLPGFALGAFQFRAVGGDLVALELQFSPGCCQFSGFGVGLGLGFCLFSGQCFALCLDAGGFGFLLGFDPGALGLVGLLLCQQF